MLQRQSERRKKGDTSVQEELISLKDVMAKKKATKKTISAQQTIPYKKLERNGVMITDDCSSRTLTLMSQSDANNSDSPLLSNAMDALMKLNFENTRVNLTIVNKEIGRRRLVQTAYAQDTGTKLEKCKKVINKEITMKMYQCMSTITSLKYLTISESSDLKKRDSLLDKHIEEALSTFEKNGITSVALNGEGRMRVIGNIFNIGANIKYNIDWQAMRERGLSTKDYVAPSSFNFSDASTAVINGKPTTVVTLIPSTASPDFSLLTDLANREKEQVLNISLRNIDPKSVKAESSDKDSVAFLNNSIKDKRMLVETGIMLRLTAETQEILNAEVAEVGALADEKGFRSIMMSWQIADAVFDCACLGRNKIEANCIFKAEEVKNIIPVINESRNFIDGLYVGSEVKADRPILITNKHGEMRLLCSSDDDSLQSKLLCKDYLVTSSLNDTKVIFVGNENIPEALIDSSSDKQVSLKDNELILNPFDRASPDAIAQLMTNILGFIIPSDSNIEMIDSSKIRDMVAKTQSEENASIQSFAKILSNSDDTNMQWYGKTLEMRLERGIKSLVTNLPSTAKFKDTKNTFVNVSAMRTWSNPIEKLLWMFDIANDADVKTGTVVYLANITPLMVNSYCSHEAIVLIKQMLAKGLTVVTEVQDIQNIDGSKLTEFATQVQATLVALTKSEALRKMFAITQEEISSMSETKDSLSAIQVDGKKMIINDSFIFKQDIANIMKTY